MSETEASSHLKDDAYGEVSALRYSIVESEPSAFALQTAPWIWRYVEQSKTSQEAPQILDVGCGTGELAAYLLDKGAKVTGLDLSPHMLEHAAAKNALYVRSGRARFVEADASSFQLPDKYETVVSTFNTLNHLPDFDAVEACLASVSNALVPGGSFLFDIDTRHGLDTMVGTNVVIDTEEEIALWKRIRFENKVILYATGCFRHDGIWARYRETLVKIYIPTAELERALSDAGFESVVFTAPDFETVIDDPEVEETAHVVARKAALRRTQ